LNAQGSRIAVVFVGIAAGLALSQILLPLALLAELPLLSEAALHLEVPQGSGSLGLLIGQIRFLLAASPIGKHLRFGGIFIGGALELVELLADSGEQATALQSRESS
jgi:hypothetical protein